MIFQASQIRPERCRVPLIYPWMNRPNYLWNPATLRRIMKDFKVLECRDAALRNSIRNRIWIE